MESQVNTIHNISQKLQPICREIVERINLAIEKQIITTDEADIALNAIIPLADVFNSKPGTYKWGLVDFNLAIMKKWTVKKYGTPIAFQDQIKNQIKSMIRANIIEVGDSINVHPTVVVAKKDNTIRICLDAFALNRILHGLHHDTRRIENILFEPLDGRIFSAFDFSQGFLQVLLSPSASKLLAFQFEGVTYLYKKLLFSTSVSSSLFNKTVRGGIPPPNCLENLRGPA